MKPKYDYDLLDKLLNKLFRLVGPDLEGRTREHVREFIDVGEYGLALDTAVAAIVEDDLQITPEAFDLIRQLAVKMKMEDEILTEDLADRVEKS